jgi:phosphatidylserine decarboxylase
MTDRLSAFAPMPKERMITPEGYPFIAIGGGVALVCALFGWAVLFFFMAFFTLFVCFFFRNPKREAPSVENALIAPADGRIIAIEDVVHPVIGNAKKISTFMSVLNCHVNRAPTAGTVENVSYKPGRFFVASLDKASEHNERNAVILKDDQGRSIAIVQIAGLVARRIVCYLKEGFDVRKGARLGLIRFGSRVDLFLPKDKVTIEVKPGDRVKAGMSLIGRWQ